MAPCRYAVRAHSACGLQEFALLADRGQRHVKVVPFIVIGAPPTTLLVGCGAAARGAMGPAALAPPGLPWHHTLPALLSLALVNACAPDRCNHYEHDAEDEDEDADGRERDHDPLVRL
eukprot:CAMPEP_0185569068 /NCGR_PEP_ID=MMETSP0434-20130131/1813_1 /TAXON_ID=626734 ORGANISM="Favella taraikaensis, Strain Fe Narragansett Bay" /NCGR_SAMPLE_ID=MMETSP0434 /ASSEMBLY_ACC=CAM_ASM_000379 /LENGTH=117 /DNA_ID=CAMNT_0028183743 /DNA_START=620 /DNA_END=973 /DNA_ORIENTATION=+